MNSGNPARFVEPFFMIFTPFFYALFGYLMTALSLYIYNVAAARFGGIELDIVPAVAALDETTVGGTLG